MRCALRIGVDRGCLVGVLHRCAVIIGGEGMVIGGEAVVWVSLRHCDWPRERGVGSDVPL